MLDSWVSESHAVMEVRSGQATAQVCLSQRLISHQIMKKITENVKDNKNKTTKRKSPSSSVIQQ
jgi:hypothetical protein